MDKGDLEKFWEKFWFIVWKDESFKGWIISIIFLFILIKLIIFPSLSFVTGTELPLAIVESCSMYHGESFDSWWEIQGNWYEDKEITKQQFEKFPLKNGFSKGHIFFVLGTKKQDLKIGDTIIFISGNANRPIIHRVVSLDPLQTKGDHNNAQFTPSTNSEKIDETNIKEDQIIGKVTRLRLPFVGWIKLIFYEPFREKNSRGFCKK